MATVNKEAHIKQGHIFNHPGHKEVVIEGHFKQVKFIRAMRRNYMPGYRVVVYDKNLEKYIKRHSFSDESKAMKKFMSYLFNGMAK